MLFQDRTDAGEQLASKLQAYRDRKDAVVLGLARGGIVVAHALAKGLNLPLDVIVVRKIGAPDNEELAIGAISETGEAMFNQELIEVLGVSKEYLQTEVARQKGIAQKRAQTYRKKVHEIKGKTAIIVDDGIATGASMRVAIRSIKMQGAKKIVLAVPVAPPDTLEEIRKMVDEIVCLYAPQGFQAVGQFYKRFDQTDDAEVVKLLKS